jgi:hypothetical protein
MAPKNHKAKPVIAPDFCGLVILTTSTGVELLAEVRDGKVFRNVAVFLIPREVFSPILEKYVTIVKRDAAAGANGRTA